MRTRAILHVAACTLFAAAASSSERPIDDERHFKELETRAVEAIEQARELGNLWSDPAGELKRARTMSENGEYAAAARLLQAAVEEARIAAEQARLEHARYVFQRLAASGKALPAAELDELWRMILEHDAVRASRLADERVQRYGP
jgi:hypothetical protein